MKKNILSTTSIMLFILISIGALIFFFVSPGILNRNKIKDCPSEKIINMMPVMCIKAPCPPIDNSYYIYNGARKEITDFDAYYVKNSCNVKETVAM